QQQQQDQRQAARRRARGLRRGTALPRLQQAALHLAPGLLGLGGGQAAGGAVALDLGELVAVDGEVRRGGANGWRRGPQQRAQQDQQHQRGQQRHRQPEPQARQAH